MRWRCSPDTKFDIRALAVWGWARYLSVSEAPHNIESLRVSGQEKLCLFETLRPEWGSNPQPPTFKAGSCMRYNSHSSISPYRTRCTDNNNVVNWSLNGSLYDTCLGHAELAGLRLTYYPWKFKINIKFRKYKTVKYFFSQLMKEKLTRYCACFISFKSFFKFSSQTKPPSQGQVEV